MSDPRIIDRAIAGAAGAPLSKDQKKNVVMAAAEAWENEGRPHYDPDAFERRDPLALSPAEALELWRHEEQHTACGKKHLTACTQRDYAALMAHFSRLAGRLDTSDAWAERAATNGHRQAMAKLQRTFEEVRSAIDRPTDYALAIARRQFKVTALEDCTERQLWSLAYTLRNRASARRGTRRAS
jgi:hypothetical protein